MQVDHKTRTTRDIAVLLISALLLGLFGVSAMLWFGAMHSSHTLDRADTTNTVGPASVNLAWDRSPSKSVTGYKILFGTAPRKYVESARVGDQASATLRNLRPKTRYYIAVVAIDAAGNESVPSNEIEIVTPK